MTPADTIVYESQVVPFILGFIRGAFAFGGTPHDVKQLIQRDFPRLTPGDIDDLMSGAKGGVRSFN